VGGGSCAAAGARRAPAAARTAPATVAALRAAQVPVGGRRAPARAHPATPLVPDVGQMLALMRVAWGPSRPAAPSLRTVPPPEDGAALPVRRTGYAAGACHNPRSVPPSMTPGPPGGSPRLQARYWTDLGRVPRRCRRLLGKRCPEPSRAGDVSSAGQHQVLEPKKARPPAWRRPHGAHRLDPANRCADCLLGVVDIRQRTEATTIGAVASLLGFAATGFL
jgi:hypothetical protein